MASSPAFTFHFGSFEYTVEETRELLGELSDHANYRPCWRLAHSGKGLVTLPVVPGEPRVDTISRFETWLRDNAVTITIDGRTYQLYRMARDFWTPDKDETPHYVSWVVLSGSTHITQVECRLAPSPGAAVASLREWLLAHPFTCFGGPFDGQRLRDHGPDHRPFPVGQRLARAGRPVETDGHYVRRAGGYHWISDAAAEA